MQIIKCPSCGANTEIHNPGITLATCQYCQSTLYWDKEAILQAGLKAVVPTNDSRFWLGATGSICGSPFIIIGRLHFTYQYGSWDEWYVQLDNGYGWIGEDGRSLTFRTAQEIPTALIGQKPKLGQAFLLEGKEFTVRETDIARCTGFEGELPFAVLPNEDMLYFDAATKDGRQFAILSYNKRQQARLTYGKTVAQEALLIKGQESFKSKSDRTLESTSLQCANCGAVLPTLRQNGILSQSCPNCGSINKLFSGHTQLLSKQFDFSQAKSLTLSIGQKCHLSGIKYEVCGRTISLDDDGTPSLQYLLFHPTHGYRYLEFEESSYTLFEKTQAAPSGDLIDWQGSKIGQIITVKNHKYKVKYKGSTCIKYVDGAFPWLAKVGDTTRYIDCQAGSALYSMEFSKNEVEFYHGRRLPLKEACSITGEPLGKAIFNKFIDIFCKFVDPDGDSFEDIKDVKTILIIILIIVLSIIDIALDTNDDTYGPTAVGTTLRHGARSGSRSHGGK